MRVGVVVRVGVLGTPVGVGDAVREAVMLAVALTVGVGRRVPVSVRVANAVAVFVTVCVGRRVPVSVGAAVVVAVAEIDGDGDGGGVAVSVRVASNGEVGVAVAVGRGVMVTSGSLPTRNTICCSGPAVPSVSSTRAVMIVSPLGNASTDETGRQYWTRVLASKKRCTRS
ncbi:MAG: hypothetical protein ABI629_03275 [bacterium]